MTTLESRYRRLLALYPAEHRRAFGDEMLGVLMSGAAEGQQRPRLGESANLMWNALWRRLGGQQQAQPYGHWSRAAAVIGVIGALSLFAIHIREALGTWSWGWGGALPLDHGPVSNLNGDWAPGIGAALLALIVLFGPRPLVVPAAWLLAAGEILVHGGGATLYGYDMVSTAAVVPILLALTTAIALSVPQPAREGRRLLGKAGVAALTALALIVAGSTATNHLLSTVKYYGDGSIVVIPPPFGSRLPLIIVVLSLIAGIVVLRRRLQAPVHRRVTAMLFPLGVLFVAGNEIGPIVHYPLAGLTFALIVLLAALSIVLIGRWERLLHLAELGRRVEREETGAAADPPTTTATD